MDAALGDSCHVGERDPVVDAEHLGWVIEAVSDDRPAEGPEDREHVGEVQLALGVVGVDLVKRGQQRVAVEGEQPGVDLADLKLGVGRVARRLGLDHALHHAVGVAHDAAVAAGVVEGDRPDRGRRDRALVGVHQRTDGLGAEQRSVAVEHDDGVAGGEALYPGPGGVGGSAGLLLDGQRDVGVEHALEAAIGVVDDDDLAGAGIARGGDRPGDHRPSADLVQELGRAGSHPGPLARGEDDNDWRGHAQNRSGRTPGNDRSDRPSLRRASAQTSAGEKESFLTRRRRSSCRSGALRRNSWPLGRPPGP